MAEQKTQPKSFSVVDWLKEVQVELQAKLSQVGIQRPKRVGRILWVYMLVKEFNYEVPDNLSEIIEERMRQVKNDEVDLRLTAAPEKYLIREADRAKDLENLKGTSLNRFGQVIDFLHDEEPQKTLDECQAWILGEVRAIQPNASKSLERRISESLVTYCETNECATRDARYDDLVQIRRIPARKGTIRFQPRKEMPKTAVDDLVEALSCVTNRYEAKMSEALRKIHEAYAGQWDFKQFIILSCAELWREIQVTRRCSGWEVLNDYPWAKEVRQLFECSKRCFLFRERQWAYCSRNPTDKEHQFLIADTFEHSVPLSQRKNALEKKVSPDSETNGPCTAIIFQKDKYVRVKAPKRDLCFFDHSANEGFWTFYRENPGSVPPREIPLKSDLDRLYERTGTFFKGTQRSV